MKLLLCCLTAVLLTGCSALSAREKAQSSSAPALAGATPQYHHQLEYIEAEGQSTFLYLAEGTDP